jgi:hypothetical protein
MLPHYLAILQYQLGPQQDQTNNNIVPNKALVTTSKIKTTYVLLQRGDPLPSTIRAKSPNTIWKSKAKQNLATYFALTALTLASKNCPHISNHTDGGLPFWTREEGEITLYVELWDNGKRVTTRMPGEGGGLRREGYRTETGNSWAVRT